MKKLFAIILALGFVGGVAYSQYGYVKCFPDTNFKNMVHGLAVDPAGNLWVATYYAIAGDSVDVYGRPGVKKAVRAVRIYKPDGTQMPFSPIKLITIGSLTDTLDAALVGLKACPDGNILLCRSYRLYKINYKTGVGMTKWVPKDSMTLAGPAVDNLGEIFVGRVYPDYPLNILDKDFNDLGNAIDKNSAGYTRSNNVSADGNDLYVTAFSSNPMGLWRYHSSYGSLGPYVCGPTDTLLKGMSIESSDWNKKTGILYVSSGGQSPSLAPWTNIVWYGWNPTTKAVVDSIKWNLTASPSVGANDVRPRAIAFSPTGDTVYVGHFNGLGPGIEMFTKAAAATKNVTFQVHMGIQMQLNKSDATKGFNAAKDTLVMRGDFAHLVGQTDWSGYYFKLAKSATNDSIYTITISFPGTAVATTIQFKYVILNGKDNWESVDNRTYAITADASQNLPLVYFDNRTSVGVTHNVTFQADMSALITAGFNASTDSINVEGDFNGWASAQKMTKSLLNPSLYQYKVSLTYAVGATINYKFKASPDAKFDNTGWETGDNRTLVFADKDTVLASALPRITVKAVITKDVVVTFRLNMANAKERYHNKAITGLTSVWIAGSATPLQWPGSWVYTDTLSGGALLKMYDDGSAAHGDSAAGDNVYSNKLTFKASDNTSRNIEYKFGAIFTKVDTLNAGVSYLDNEAGYAVNHKVSLNDVTGTQAVYDRFGGQIVSVKEIKEATPGGVPEGYFLSQNYPNPFNPSTQIRFTLAHSGMTTLKVYDVLGREVETLVNETMTAGSYEVTFNASNLPSGTYFYVLTAGGNRLSSKMSLLK